MKLLFDEQLSPELAHRLAATFPGSAHVHEIGLGSADDRAIWTHARDHGFTLVTKDADIVDLAMAWGFPPKVVWIRIGNCTTVALADRPQAAGTLIASMDHDPEVGIVSIT